MATLYRLTDVTTNSHGKRIRLWIADYDSASDPANPVFSWTSNIQRATRLERPAAEVAAQRIDDFRRRHAARTVPPPLKIIPLTGGLGVAFGERR